MKDLYYKKVKIVFICLVILSFYLISCDKLPFKIPFFGSKDATAPQKQESSPVKVTGTIIAKVNNLPITLEDLNEDIESYNNLVAQDNPQLKITTKEQKIDYLKNEMIRRSLIYQEASRRGLDKKEDIARILEKTKQDLLVVELVRQEAENVDATTQEINDYYNNYKDQLKEPEERQIREIVVPTEFEAKEILIQLLQGGDFATIASQRSKVASSKNGGDLGFIKKGTKNFKEFDEIAFSDTLEAGKISNIFKGSDGYYIIKLEAKRGGKQMTLSEMWDDIKRALIFLKQQQKIENIINQLTANAKIEVYEGAIQ
jgi:parvulin-like peptidyl-prolyl isomerase